MAEKIKKKVPLSGQYCVFRCGGKLHGIHITAIKEICADFQLTPVYHSDKTISGLVNIRGQIHLIADMNLLMRKECISSLTSRLILFKDKIAPSFGIFVEEVGDIIEVLESQIISNQFFQSEEEVEDYDNLVKTFVKLDSETLVVLDPELIFQATGKK